MKNKKELTERFKSFAGEEGLAVPTFDISKSYIKDGVFYFSAGESAQIEIYKSLSTDEAGELVQNGEMCQICLMPFENYDDLDAT